MEAPETAKPDLVFDGVLSFEKGASNNVMTQSHTLCQVCVKMQAICSCDDTPSGGGEGILFLLAVSVNKCKCDKVYSCQFFHSYICRSSFCATWI